MKRTKAVSTTADVASSSSQSKPMTDRPTEKSQNDKGSQNTTRTMTTTMTTTTTTTKSYQLEPEKHKKNNKNKNRNKNKDKPDRDKRFPIPLFPIKFRLRPEAYHSDRDMGKKAYRRNWWS